jgi:hypothetical protein
MNIQGNEVYVSGEDVVHALSGAESVGDPDFVEYTRLLFFRLVNMNPEVTSDIGDTVGSCIPVMCIPYSKKVVEMMGIAIAEGKKTSEELRPLLQQVIETYAQTAANNKAMYAAQDRASRRRNYTVINNDIIAS